MATSKMPWYDNDENIIGIFGIGKDITNRKKAEEKIKRLTFHDPLTNLYNRAFFDEELIRLDSEGQLPMTVLMGDVNGLKLINDSAGHLKGDELLKKIAEIFKISFRKEDIIDILKKAERSMYKNKVLENKDNFEAALISKKPK